VSDKASVGRVLCRALSVERGFVVLFCSAEVLGEIDRAALPALLERERDPLVTLA